jgi:predicted dinucleotide-binding enzyme
LSKEVRAMKIAVIGTSNVGSALARGFSRAGHEVILRSRRPGEREVRALAAETKERLIWRRRGRIEE